MLKVKSKYYNLNWILLQTHLDATRFTLCYIHLRYQFYKKLAFQALEFRDTNLIIRFEFKL